MEIAREQGEFFLRGGVFGSGSVERGRGRVGLAAGRARRRFRMRGFFLFLFGLGGEVAGAEEGEAEDESGKNGGAGSWRHGEFCSADVKTLRPEGLSYTAK